MRVWILIFAILFLLGCEKLDISISEQFSDAGIKVRIFKIRDEFYDKAYWYVHGKVEIEVLKKGLKQINLNCFQMKIDEKLSNAVYYNQFGGRDIASYPLGGDVTKADLYWQFDAEIKDLESSKISILLFDPSPSEPKEIPCFVYSSESED